MEMNSTDTSQDVSLGEDVLLLAHDSMGKRVTRFGWMSIRNVVNSAAIVDLATRGLLKIPPGQPHRGELDAIQRPTGLTWADGILPDLAHNPFVGTWFQDTFGWLELLWRSLAEKQLAYNEGGHWRAVPNARTEQLWASIRTALLEGNPVDARTALLVQIMFVETVGGEKILKRDPLTKSYPLRGIRNLDVPTLAPSWRDNAHAAAVEQVLSALRNRRDRM